MVPGHMANAQRYKKQPAGEGIAYPEVMDTQSMLWPKLNDQRSAVLQYVCRLCNDAKEPPVQVD